jgi:hypothetical protein
MNPSLHRSTAEALPWVDAPLLPLVIEVERTFGVRIPIDQLERLRQVGQLHEYLCQRLSLADRRGGMPQRIYQRVQGVLQQEVMKPGLRIRPSTPLAEVLPPPGEQRLLAWRRLDQHLPWRLPKLRISEELRDRMARAFELGCMLNLVLALLLVLAASLIGYSQAGSAQGAAGASAAAVVGLLAANVFLWALPEGLLHSGLTWLVAPMEDRRAVHLGPGMTRVSDLVDAVMVANFRQLVRRNDLGQSDAWFALRWLIAQQSRVPVERITAQTRLAPHSSASPADHKPGATSSADKRQPLDGKQRPH